MAYHLDTEQDPVGLLGTKAFLCPPFIEYWKLASLSLQDIPWVSRMQRQGRNGPETIVQPWGRVLVPPQGIHRTVSLSCFANTESPTRWEKLAVINGILSATSVNKGCHSQQKLLLLFRCSAMFNSLQPHGLQHVRLPCPSLSPGVCSNSWPLSLSCYPTILSSSEIAALQCELGLPRWC